MCYCLIGHNLFQNIWSLGSVGGDYTLVGRTLIIIRLRLTMPDVIVGAVYYTSVRLFDEQFTTARAESRYCLRPHRKSRERHDPRLGLAHHQKTKDEMVKRMGETSASQTPLGCVSGRRDRCLAGTRKTHNKLQAASTHSAPVHRK